MHDKKYLKSKRPYLALLYWLGPLVVVLGLLLYFSPNSNKAPEGFSSSIVAFEFSNSIEKLKLTLNPLTQSEINGLDILNKLDFIFMSLYGSLLFGFLWMSGKLQNNRLFKYASVLPGLVVLFDVFENIQMFKLTEAYTGNPALSTEITAVLNRMYVLTQLKWGLLSIIFLIIAKTVWINASKLKYMAFLFLLPFMGMCFSYISGSNKSIDQYTSSVFLVFALLFIYIGFYKRMDLETKG